MKYFNLSGPWYKYSSIWPGKRYSSCITWRGGCEGWAELPLFRKKGRKKAGFEVP